MKADFVNAVVFVQFNIPVNQFIDPENNLRSDIRNLI